jgi:hypothetical protein
MTMFVVAVVEETGKLDVEFDEGKAIEFVDEDELNCVDDDVDVGPTNDGAILPPVAFVNVFKMVVLVVGDIGTSKFE